jgi:hexosaminidase
MLRPSFADDRTPALLPIPASVTDTDGSFILTQDTVILTDPETRPVGELLASMLAPALGFALRVDTGNPSNSPAITLGIDARLAALGPEGYRLTVTPHSVALHGSSVAGVFYATQTLRQLLPTDIFSATPIAREWWVPAVTIEDTPRFQWRGLLLDTARHFVPKDEILKLIDLLALHKMNVLHLHLTDDQGWRIEITRYPRLTEVGSRRARTLAGHARAPEGYDDVPHGGFYTQDDLHEIVAYALARQVTVVPEIEMPGHAQAAIAAYPEFGVSGKPVEVGTMWGIFPHLFNPDEATIRFLQNVLAEVLVIFPSRFIHLGGDEAVKAQWQSSSRVQARIVELGLKDEEDLQRWFLSRLGAFLAQHGRRLIGWDEMLDGGLPADAAVMSWRGITGGIVAAQQGHNVVMAPSTHVYLDSYQSNAPTEPLAIGRYTPLDAVYGYEPVPDVLTDKEAQHILGVQCAIWSEYISTAEHLEYMAFPRMIALAEVAWTSAARRDFSDFRRRLATHEARLAHLNVRYRPVATWELEPAYPPRPDPYAGNAEEPAFALAEDADSEQTP